MERFDCTQLKPRAKMLLVPKFFSALTGRLCSRGFYVSAEKM